MKYNYFDLINSYNISIPLIQRDYAQGRESAKEIRTNFVSSLKNTLLKSGDNLAHKIHLDFVYGFVEADNTFVPLDGQQRLTTLFLLHWYIGSKEGLINTKIDDDKSNNLKQILEKFSYQTRVSSKRFCKALIQNPIVIGSNEKLSEYIRDAEWFMSSWDNDPTVMSMLNMLDSIHLEFSESEDLWIRLTDNEIITFEFIDIKSEEFKLTDELYIKMNSRGKPLTSFENFKAQFTDLLKNPKSDFKDLTIDFEESQISYQSYFAIHIDGKWMDLFWSYRSKLDIEIDDAILNFLNYITQLLHYKKTSASFDFNWETIKSIYSSKTNVDFLFNSLNFLANLESVPLFFESIFSNSTYVKNKIKLFDDRTTDLFFRLITENSFETRHHILFYAIIKYCTENVNSAGDKQLLEFIRIQRNLLLRVRQVNGKNRIDFETNLRLSNFNDYRNFTDALINLIKTNADNRQSVYQLFVENEFKGFTKEVLDGEKRKIQSILLNILHEDAIIKLEEHNQLQGITNNFDLESESIAEYVEAFYEIWDSNEINNSQIVRALLSQNDYSINTHTYSSLGSIWYFGSEQHWHRILTSFDMTERIQISNALSGLLSAYIIANGNDVKEKLYNIIDSYSSEVRDWRYYFIKYSEFTSVYKDSFNLFSWSDDNDFEINSLGNSGKQPLASYHYNPYLQTVCNRIGNEKKLYLSRGRYTDDISCLFLLNKILIYCVKDGWEIFNLHKHKNMAHLVKKFNLDSIGKHYFLKETNEKDRIEITLDFCREAMI